MGAGLVWAAENIGLIKHIITKVIERYALEREVRPQCFDAALEKIIDDIDSIYARYDVERGVPLRSFMTKSLEFTAMKGIGRELKILTSLQSLRDERGRLVHEPGVLPIEYKQDDREAVLFAIRQCDDAEREILTLRFVLDWTYDEIALHIGLGNRCSAWVRVKKALDKIKEQARADVERASREVC